MRLRGLLLILVAVALAGATAVMVRNWLEAERSAAAAAIARANTPAPATRVLVAKQDLPVGQFVRLEHLRWQPWPQDGVAPTYAVEGRRALEDFVGAVVRLPVSAGEPVTDARIISPGNSGFLAAVLQPGMRAMSVPVTMTSGISGFIFPGDRVDLILTHVVPQDTSGQAVTQDRRASSTALRDIRVIAIDQKIEMKPGETAVARTATLEVTPKQSEMIAVLVEMGKLSLSLRSLARSEDIAGGTAEPPDPPVQSYTLDSELSRVLPPIAVAGTVRKVSVLRGDKADEVKLQQVSR